MSEDVQDKKAAIMEAALILFNRRGFHGTPTSMISEQSGVSTGTLFRFYRTKDELINSVYFAAKESLGRAIYRGDEGDKDLRSQVKRIWGNLIRWGVENPEEFMFIQQFSSSPFITDITQEEVEKNFLFLFDLLDEAVRNGLLKNMERRLAIEMLYQANAAVVRRVLQDGDTRDIDGVIDRSFDIMWSGISRK